MNKNSPILIAELGATNARLDIIQDNQSLSKKTNYLMEEYDSVESIFEDFLTKTGIKTKRAIMGVAAPVLEDQVQFVNINIKFSQNELRKKMFKDQLIVLNDLELQAYAIETLKKKDVLPIGTRKKQLEGSRILVCPGTGLGLAGIVEGNVKATEAGHLHIPSNLSTIYSIVEGYEREHNRMPSFEDLLSGKGLNFIYCFLTNSPSTPYSNEEILSETKDPNCLKTKKLMLCLLAVFLRYMALIWGATGGVYVSGSMANSLILNSNSQDFRSNFEGKDQMKIFLINTPLFLILDDNLGLRGALKIASNC